jgi:hypothetical protein
MRLVGLFAFVVSLSIPASASNWAKVSSNKTGAIFLDAESVERAGNTVKVWLKLTVDKIGKDGVAYEKVRWSFDCENRTIAVLADIVYSAQGEVVQSRNVPDFLARSEAIVPDSTGDSIAPVVCPRR